MARDSVCALCFMSAAITTRSARATAGASVRSRRWSETANPRCLALAMLSKWSPKSGTPTRGTAWKAASSMELRPPCVSSARHFGCPNRSFCGTQLDTSTLSGITVCVLPEILSFQMIRIGAMLPNASASLLSTCVSEARLAIVPNETSTKPLSASATKSCRLPGGRGCAGRARRDPTWTKLGGIIRGMSVATVVVIRTTLSFCQRLPRHEPEPSGTVEFLIVAARLQNLAAITSNAVLASSEAKTFHVADNRPMSRPESLEVRAGSYAVPVQTPGIVLAVPPVPYPIASMP
mmetsp:Transcript_21736/g.43752  ORF Transcript_21736/g.43752 Transcript_21736/m.43752 type:complete len:292 (+) Transcript_21736:595-1470(+)